MNTHDVFHPRYQHSSCQYVMLTCNQRCIILTCYTKDNQQGCFRLSNWFSLRRLGPWMNHLPPAWSSTFRLTFENESWYVNLEWDFIYLKLFLASVHGFMHATSDCFLLHNNLFIYQLLCTLIYRRRSFFHLCIHLSNSFKLNQMLCTTISHRHNSYSF